MRLLALAAALSLTLPTAVIAEEATPPAEQPAKKERKICREEAPRTGSNRPGKRICRTAAEWKAYSQADADFDGTARQSQHGDH